MIGAGSTSSSQQRGDLNCLCGNIETVGRLVRSNSLTIQVTKTVSENVQDWHYMVRELTCKVTNSRNGERNL
jgi:hypothetical protein